MKADAVIAGMKERRMTGAETNAELQRFSKNIAAMESVRLCARRCTEDQPRMLCPLTPSPSPPNKFEGEGCQTK